jgi:hypothetical protein
VILQVVETVNCMNTHKDLGWVTTAGTRLCTGCTVLRDRAHGCAARSLSGSHGMSSCSGVDIQIFGGFFLEALRWVTTPGTRCEYIPVRSAANLLLAKVPGGVTHPQVLVRIHVIHGLNHLQGHLCPLTRLSGPMPVFYPATCPSFLWFWFRCRWLVARDGAYPGRWCSPSTVAGSSHRDP